MGAFLFLMERVMASRVYFTSLRAGLENNLLVKIKRLAQAAGLEKIVREKRLTAVKIPFFKTNFVDRSRT